MKTFLSISCLVLAARTRILPLDDNDAALEACRIPGIEREIKCGTVRMPEDPDSPASRTIDVRFAIVPAVARNKQPDPVFIFAGGPGQAATALAAGDAGAC